MAELHIAEFENTIVLYFQTSEPRINAYALAATLVALSDSAKAAARTLNSGVEIEIVVEALNSGSFRAKAPKPVTEWRPRAPLGWQPLSVDCCLDFLAREPRTSP